MSSQWGYKGFMIFKLVISFFDKSVILRAKNWAWSSWSKETKLVVPSLARVLTSEIFMTSAMVSLAP
uniref:Uncharacterized protein n=1 Tax=Romanomermis culicivorax TaxID=13658 RepID=A0A915KZB6_ROMCU